MDETKMAVARQTAANKLIDESDELFITAKVMQILRDLYAAGAADALAEAAKPQAFPIGTLVDYHGSVKYMHGRYRITNKEPDRTGRENYYPDGVMYSLWARKQSFSEHSLYNVSRSSITLVPEQDSMVARTAADHGDIYPEPDSDGS